MPSLLKQWLEAMKLGNIIPDEKSLLCSDHFEKDCFRAKGPFLCLKNNAVPTIFSSTERKESDMEVEPARDINTPSCIDNSVSETCKQHFKRASCEDLPSPKIKRSDSLISLEYSFKEIIGHSVPGTKKVAYYIYFICIKNETFL